MHLHLLAVGQRMPAWVTTAWQEYSGRFPPHMQLRLTEIPAPPRNKGESPHKAMTLEGERLLRAVPKGAGVIALDVKGRPWSTEQLADRLRDWMQSGSDIALLVGGADGLAPECLAAAGQKWSLGPLTLPHPLVRVVVAEQLYRAWSIINNHPYHRA